MYGQTKGDIYRRNSLCVGVISNPNTSSSSITDLIYAAVKEYEVSDKYNDHNIGIPVADISSINIDQQDIKEYRKTQERSFLNKINGTLTTVNNVLATGLGEQVYETPELDEEMTIIKLNIFLASNNVPALLIAKWFNASNTLQDGSYYNMSLIQERGAYNASELDVLKAKESVRGMSILKDAGMELIPNTYVILVSLKLETASEVLASVSTMTESAFNYLSSKVEDKKASSLLSDLGSQLGRANYKLSKTTAGYYITATTYLFKLRWDEDIENLFISKYYEQSPQYLLNSTDFEVEFIDYSKQHTQLTEKTSFQEQDANNRKLVKRATIQAIDKSIADLQKKHEDFKVKTPLIDVSKNEATAFIGYKEGLDESTKFEVLERIYNESKNTYRYKKVGTLKVDKKRIWDNRYNLDGLPPSVGDEEDGIIQSDVDRTYLKGSTKDFAPGMLIRQIK